MLDTMRARTLFLAGLLVLGCGGDPPDPGFEPLSGGSTGSGAAGAEGGGGSSSPSTNGPGPSTTPSTTTTAQGGDDVGGGGNGGSPDGGGGAGLGCVDADDEPNDTESSAIDLGVITDCDGDGGVFGGILEGINDQDWFKYQASDDFGCSVDATRDITSSHEVRFCKYAQCTNGSDPSVDCPTGAQTATSPDGRPGCCSDEGFSFAPDCSGISDDVYVYMHLRTQVNECVTYSVEYHY